MKKIVFLVLILVFALIELPSLATNEMQSWICPNCNKNITTNYCPDCGYQKPKQTSNPSFLQPTTDEVQGYSKKSFLPNNLFSLGTSIMREDAKQIENVLLDNSFSIYKVNNTGYADYNLRQYKSNTYPYYFALFVEKDTERIGMVEFAFSPSKVDYAEVYKSLTKVLGQPKIGSSQIYFSEAAIWYRNGIMYRLLGDNWTGVFKRSRCNISDIKNGKHNFSLIMTIDDGDRDLPTVAPTPKPTSSPKIGNDIIISSVRLGKDSIGSPQLYVVFKNNTSLTIDRIDFNVECYDAYGRLIKGYGFYDSSDCFYDETKIRPNGKSSSQIYWTFYGFDGIKSVKIAITAYHTINGKSIRIPEKLWDYKNFKFN